MLLVTIAYIIFYFIKQLFIFKCFRKKRESKKSLVGKTVIITGASSGIGYQTALKLTEKGARVILACRNLKKGNQAKETIVNMTKNSNVIVKELDLSKLNSIRKFAKDILKSDWVVNVLVNNAGACSLPDSMTEDGLLESVQVNHYGSFLLTLLLLPKLKSSQPSRIVNVSSLIYIFGRANVDHINKPSMNRVISYANSKLYNLVFHEELSRRLRDSGVVVNSVHPGIIKTNILDAAYCCGRILFNAFCWIFGRTVEEGADMVVYVSLADELEDVTGQFFMDYKIYPVLPKVNNTEFTKMIWLISEKMVKFDDYDKKNCFSEISNL